tara:strand:- start:667 stop:867 length:201 start_codon:yes stop_codon:yes gene_type:complete
MKILLALILLTATGCENALVVLDGATHAKGTVHLEGYLTDSEADMELCKVPEAYTVEQAVAFCTPD